MKSSLIDSTSKYKSNMSAHAAEIHYHRTGICVDLRGSVCKQGERERDAVSPLIRVLNISWSTFSACMAA